MPKSKHKKPCTVCVTPDVCRFRMDCVQAEAWPEKVSFTVPLVPPSVNHYKMRTRKGVTFVSKEAKAFKEAVAIYGRGLHVEAEAYHVTTRIFLGVGQRGDVDNFLKCALDGLAAAHIIRSDAAVQKITAEKFRDRENPRTEFTIEAI